jgi:hypothetical protein
VAAARGGSASPEDDAELIAEGARSGGKPHFSSQRVEDNAFQPVAARARFTRTLRRCSQNTNRGNEENKEGVSNDNSPLAYLRFLLLLFLNKPYGACGAGKK